MQYNFGTGSLYLVPSGSNPTPVQVGTLQEVSLTIEKSIKELRGAYQFPVAIGEGAGKIDGTAKSGNINSALVAALLAGSTTTTGSSLRVSPNEVGTIPGTPFQITVAQSAQFSSDLGVYNVTDQKPMVRVASSPATGQYSVSAGVYTFAAADAADVVWISYAYTSTSGNTVAFTNQLMGGGTEFRLDLFNFSQGKHMGIRLHAARLFKMGLPFKNDDFMVEDLSIAGYADSSGNVISVYTAE